MDANHIFPRERAHPHLTGVRMVEKHCHQMRKTHRKREQQHRTASVDVAAVVTYWTSVAFGDVLSMYSYGCCVGSAR